MPKARQIGGWLVIAGVALMMQGCWEDELTWLGEGGCRTADNSQGNHVYISNLTFEECKTKCLEADGQCTALEYNTNNSACEIHSDDITKFVQVAGVSCYVRN